MGKCMNCEPYETEKIEHCDKKECGYKLQGVGKDAEIITNEKGGKQSKAPLAMHLIDPCFLADYAENKAAELEETSDDSDNKIYAWGSIYHIAKFMQTNNDKTYLDVAITYLELTQPQKDTLESISSVLQYGASRYKPNNWRLIPQEEHINHALIHIYAFILGDTQDDHIDHALCRLMMAMATEKSPDFSYTQYIKRV